MERYNILTETNDRETSLGAAPKLFNDAFSIEQPDVNKGTFLFAGELLLRPKHGAVGETTQKERSDYATFAQTCKSTDIQDESLASETDNNHKVALVTDSTRRSQVTTVTDKRAQKVKELVEVLKGDSSLDKVIRNVQEAYRSEQNKRSMEDLTRRVNKDLKGTGISLDVHPFRNHRKNMAVTIKKDGRSYEVFVGAGKSPKGW